MDTATQNSRQTGLATIDWSARPRRGTYERFWERAYFEAVSSSRALAHRIRNRLIRVCLEIADHLQRIEAEAIAREAVAIGGARRWVLGPPPPVPRLPRREPSIPPHATLPRAALIVESPIPARGSEVPDLDEAPTAVYHPIPSPDR